jgi:hypothetical protein
MKNQMEKRGTGKIVLSEEIKSTFKDAAKKLTGSRKREFTAKVTEDYLAGSARQAESVFGWKRQSVELGLQERRTGIVCVDNYQARGRHKSEESRPQLATDILSLVEGKSQADPKFQSTFAYARISARAVRAALITDKGYDQAQLPNRQTIGSILNRMGYRLKKLKKQNP